jgi:hypothetical protein
MTPLELELAAKATRLVSRVALAKWPLIAVVVDGEELRIAQRGSVVRDLHQADLPDLERAVRSAGARPGEIVIIEIAEAGVRVSVARAGATQPRILYSTMPELTS